MIDYSIKHFEKSPQENIKAIINNLKPIFGDYFGDKKAFDKVAEEKLNAFLKNGGLRTAMLISIHSSIIGREAPGAEMIPVMSFMQLLNRKRSMALKQGTSKIELPIDSQEYILSVLLEKLGFKDAYKHSKDEINEVLDFYLDRYYEYVDKATLWNESNFIGYFYICILAALSLDKSVTSQDKYILLYRIGEAYGLYDIDPYLQISDVRGYGSDRKEISQAVQNSIKQYGKFMAERDVEDENADIVNPSFYTKSEPSHYYGDELIELVNKWYGGELPKNLWKNIHDFKK